MSGETEVRVVDGASVRVANLTVGQRVAGVGDDLRTKTCEVVAIGQWGNGTVYGNYTQ